MSNSRTRIPSPARSMPMTPRRRETPRKTRSVCSPARSNASGKLSSIIQEHREQAMGSFVLSPLTRKSVLSDNTDIQEPGRKSWWRDLGETSRDVMEVLKNNDVQANNIFDNIEVMSQEKKHHTLDIPDSSDSESIHSIVIPQRKLFHEKENQPQKRFNPFGTRETLDIIHKADNTTIVDKTVNVATKELFHAEPKSRPVFPAALLDMSANTTASNKTITTAVEPKARAHNLFSKQKIENKSQLAKRKNMFAKFIASDSEDDEELPEIQPKFFALQKKPNLRRSSISHGVDNSMTSSIDIELDDWQLLPSSTMVDHQLNTTQTTEQKSKKIRLTKLSEAEVGTNSSIISKTQSNKSVSSKNKSMINEKSLQGNTSIVTRNSSKISKVEEEVNKSLNKPNSSSNTSQSLVITRSKNKSDVANKSQNASINKSLNTNKNKNTSKLSKKQTDVDRNSLNKSKSKNSTPEQQLQNNDMDIDNLDAEIELQPADDDEELNFTLEYEDDKVDDAVTSKQNISAADQLMTNDNCPINTSQKNVDMKETSIKNATTTSKMIDKEQIEVIKESANSCEDNKSLASKPDTIEVVVNKVGNDEMSKEENLIGNIQNDSPKSHIETKQTDEIDKNDNEEKNQVLTVQEQSNTNKFNQENGNVQNQVLKGLGEEANVQDQMSEIPSNESRKDRQESTEKENDDQKHCDKNQENTQNEQDQSIEIQDVSQSKIIQDTTKIRQDDQEVQSQESDDEKDETCEKEQDNVSEEEREEENEEEIDEENEEEPDEKNEEEVDEENEEEKDEESQEEQDESLEVQSESQEIEDESQEVQDESTEVQESQEVQDEDQDVQGEIHKEQDEKQDDSLEEQDEILAEQDKSQGKQNKSKKIDDDIVEENDNETENNEIQEEENISSEEMEQNISNQDMECEVSGKSKEDDSDLEENLDNESDPEEKRDNDSDLEGQDNASDEVDNADHDSDQVEMENESDNENETESENESIKASEESENNQGTDNDDDQIENTETPNVSHDTTGRYRKKSITPEAILHNSRNIDDLTTVHGRNTSVRKTKSLIQHLNIRQSLEPARESMEFSDGNRNSSAEGSGWDSHRTTRKTLRQTFGKDFTPRKSLRAMVMEKSAKRRTTAVNDVSRPQANSTEFPVPDHSVDDYEMDVTPAEPEVSIRTRQATIEECLVRAKRDWDQEKAKMEEAVKRRLEHDRLRVEDVFKVPSKPTFRRPIAKPKTKVLKPLQTLMGLKNLPEELIEDMNYKPPKRFAPRNAAWLTKRLYKYLETKLEPKYDYKARVRAEKFAQVLYEFVQTVRRRGAPAVAPSHSVDALKREMARLNIVKTHFEFYNFFHDFMPREVRIKVIPDIVNKIPHPRNGVFSDIL